jgi:ribonuclease P/MRP protein subunit RPP40
VRDSKSYDCTVASGVPQGSVLGPLLFVIYISDLNSIIDVDHVFFADHGKLYGNPSSQFQYIQDSLVKISHWCRDWLIQINIEKCEVLHLGKNNPHLAYVINNKNLKEVESHNDLGVIVNQNLSWSDHICFITKRANRSSCVMFKVFRRLDFETFKKLYKVYIRPLLEYANVIWSPHLQRDIDTLERIQRRATKRVAGLRSIPYATRLQMLDLPTLQHRRRRGDLIWTYKILTNNESDELLNLFEFNTNIHLRGHRFKLKIQNFKTSVRSHFLPNRVFSDWNALSDEIVNASNPNIFKNKLDAHFR